MIPDYLVSFDTSIQPVEEIDCLIVGGGVAGLRASLELAGLDTLVVCKNGLGETSTYNAQGGIAAALAEGDTPARHAEDTIRAGAGLNDPAAVALVTGEGFDRVKELIDWGIGFDRSGGKLHFTREGGHSCSRILHADGDATGKRIAEFLYRRAVAAGVRIAHGMFLVDIIAAQGAAVGAVLMDEGGALRIVRARAVVLASGGAGQIYQDTTNPASITGDGHAAAYRKNARMMDLEFFQFHPTTFYLAGAPRFLISEAVRGEGGVLLNARGERFMAHYHPAAELAPRDIVTRAILDQMRKTGTNCVHLSLAHLKPSVIRRRFPTILAFCGKYGFSLLRDSIPVRPSAHYFMGGVRTDLDGETSIRNLFACGEVACTGAQGANRIASNSLLEGLVFGRRAGRAVRERGGARQPSRFRFRYTFPQKADILIDRDDLKRSIKSVMWRNVGIVRTEDSLTEAMERIENWKTYAFMKSFPDPGGFESQNMLILADLICRAALMRTESRGSHYRTDHRRRDPSWDRKHIVAARNRPLCEERL